MSEQLTSLVELQERSCKKFAKNNIFGTKKDGRYQWITYGEFGDLVEKFRGALALLGVERGDKVAVISDNRVEWAVGAYATYSLGAHYVPMYESQLPKDWKYIIDDSGSKVVLTAKEHIYKTVQPWIEELETLQHVICFDTDENNDYSYAAHLKKGAENPVDSVQPDSDETAGLIYTSGTTGKPKGVILSHGNIISNVNAVHDAFPMSDADVSLSFLPWAHSFGQTCELHTLISIGAALGLAESVKTLMDNFMEVRPTLLFAVPRIFNKIYDGLQKKMAKESPLKQFLFNKGMEIASKRRQLEEQGKSSLLVNLQFKFFDKLIFSKVRDRFGGRLRYVFSGGAALSKTVAEFIDNIGIMVFEGYGLTETSPIVTVNRPGKRRMGTIGTTITGVKVYVCDLENGDPLPEGEEGELVVIGPNVMKGYHNKPEETEKVIFELNGERAFKTGDMARIEDGGFVKITGRVKEQYKLENGKYVVPAPLEELLALSGFINQAFIYGMNRPYNIVLIVPDFSALEEWAKEHGIDTSDREVLIKNEKVHELYGKEIEKFAKDFKGYEKPKKWALLLEEFSLDNDMMTPKMSIKRRNVIKHYQSLIDSLYQED